MFSLNNCGSPLVIRNHRISLYPLSKIAVTIVEVNITILAANSKMLHAITATKKGTLFESVGNDKIENCHSNLGRPVAQQEQSVSSVLIPDSYPDTLYIVTSKNHIGPLHVQLTVDGKSISMQVDTGAAASLISQATYSSLWDTPPPLTKSNTSLITYTGEQVPILGTLMTHALYKEQSHRLPLYVKGKRPSLLGRDWLNFIRLDWKEICTFHQPSKLDRILKPTLLVHFNPNKQLILSCNASSIGVGTVLKSTYLLCLENSVPH